MVIGMSDLEWEYRMSIFVVLEFSDVVRVGR